MLRVLHVMGCSDAGGISSVVLNYYRFLDRSRIHFDIALTVPTAGQNAHALEKLGAKIYFIPLKSQDMEGYRRELTRLLVEGHYDALHDHEDETCYVGLRLARKLGIPCRIAHSHTTSPHEGLRGELRRLSGCLLNYPSATHVIGCGRLAGERVFGKFNMRRPRALVLPNAVDCRRFAFDPRIRQEVRRELGAEDHFVIGMVGRLSEEKNPGYGIRILPEILKKIPNALLVMAGNGPEAEKLEEEVKRLHLEGSVKLLGRRSDVERLYQAFDLYLLPSFTEGFPVAAVEALASGLPALLSDTITKELSAFTAVTYLPLSRPEEWAQAAADWRGDENRALRQKEVEENGLDIRKCAGILEQIYHEDTGK